MDMTKNVDVPLTNPSGDTVTKLYYGVGWSASGQGTKGLMGKLNRKKGVDLDVAAVAFDDSDDPIRMAWFDNLNPFGDGSLLLSGDNTTGNGNTELGKFFPPIDSMQNAIVLGYVTRGVGGWNHTVVKTMGSGQGKQGIINLARDYLN